MTTPAKHRIFAVKCDHKITRHTLSSLRTANADDRNFCAWLRTAPVGEEYRNGGGASPLFITVRLT